MNSNKIERKSEFEVQSFDGGYAVFLATYETVEHIRTGVVEKQIVSNQKISHVYGHKVPAFRQMARMMDSQPFNSFRKRQ